MVAFSLPGCSMQGEDVQVASARGAKWKAFPSAESTSFNGNRNGFIRKKPLPAVLCRAGAAATGLQGEGLAPWG